MSGRYYILDEAGQPIVANSLIEWAEFFEDTPRRIVKQTYVGRFHVSTVFIGLDHRFVGDGPPVLWETMIFPPGFGGAEIYQERYSTRAEAEEGHRVACGVATLMEEELARGH